MLPQSTVRYVCPLIVAELRFYRRVNMNVAIRRAAATKWDAREDGSRSEPPAPGRPG
jgi:hypothetical protein